MVERKLIVSSKDASRYGRLMEMKNVDMKAEGLKQNSTVCLKSVRFDDGATAEVRACTDDDTVWGEVWWRDPRGEITWQSKPFTRLDGWFVHGDKAVLVETDTMEDCWQGCRDLIHACAAR